MLSQNPLVRERLNYELKKVELLENNIIVHQEFIQQSSSSPDMLQVVESRHYGERGLLHISDDAFNFFLMLEQERVDRINFQKLRDLKNNMIDDSIESVRNNKELQSCFMDLFISRKEVLSNIKV